MGVPPVCTTAKRDAVGRQQIHQSQRLGKSANTKALEIVNCHNQGLYYFNLQKKEFEMF